VNWDTGSKETKLPELGKSLCGRIWGPNRVPFGSLVIDPPRPHWLPHRQVARAKEAKLAKAEKAGKALGLIARWETGRWRQMVAIIGNSKNSGSIALHRRLGFRTCRGASVF